jgi:small GTP-binding protein
MEMQDNKVQILPEEFTSYDLSFKIIVVGDSGVGKSCLTMRGTKNLFDDNYNATVGFEFFTLNLKINDTIIKLQVWDTCGQEIYRSLISNFYRNSSLAFLVYSIDK